MLQEHSRKEDSGALGFSLILHFKNFSFDTCEEYKVHAENASFLFEFLSRVTVLNEY